MKKETDEIPVTVTGDSGRSNSEQGHPFFVLDLDGTLLTDDKMVSRQDREALAALRRAGCVNVIATGRSSDSFYKAMVAGDCLVGENRLAVDYVLFSTGAGIMKFPICEQGEKSSLQSMEIIDKISLKSQLVKQITATLDELAVNYMVQRAIPDTAYFFYRFHDRGENDNCDFQNRLKLYKNYAAEWTEEQKRQFGDATQILCILPPGNESFGAKISSTIEKLYSDCHVVTATSPLDRKSIWLEIFPASVSKSQGMERIAAMLGIAVPLYGAVGWDSIKNSCG